MPIFEDTLCRLPSDVCGGKCCECAANTQREPKQRAPSATGRTLHVHCKAHVFNLGLQDLCPNSTCDRDFLGTISDLISFVASSPERVSLFQALQLEDENMNLRKFCFSIGGRGVRERAIEGGRAVWRQTVRANPPPLPSPPATSGKFKNYPLML